MRFLNKTALGRRILGPDLSINSSNGILAAMGAVTVSLGALHTYSNNKGEKADPNEVVDQHCASNSVTNSFFGQESIRKLKTLCSPMLSLPRATSMEELSSRPSSPINHTRSSNGKDRDVLMKNYDFVVLGHGNAGRSALETLQGQCPSAKIALVDPLRPLSSSNDNLTTVDYYPQAAIGFRPNKKTVELADGSIRLRYRYAVLVATGSRGAPIPLSLIDNSALKRIMELRPTEINDRAQDHHSRQHRPVFPAETVRQITLLASSEGATVGILGSGWEAVELSVAAAMAGSASPVLNFGSAGPLSHILPRYLSVSVTRRLRQCGVQVQERSLVRYIADLDHNFTKVPRLEMHTAKSYDLINTKRTIVDLLVVAPYVDRSSGTAVLPCKKSPHRFLDSLLENDATGIITQTWYQTWSQLTAPSQNDPSMIVCHANDGRIVVNAELNAASHVFAAGSVAKYPSTKTGHAHVAGEGAVDGALAGHLAALGISRDYHERRACADSKDGTPLTHDDDYEGNNDLSADTIPLFASESFPLWRSDVCSYLPSETAQSTALESVGIRALCVGNCDAEKMATHGFWWTNFSGRRKNTLLRRQRSMNISRKARPVYGAGVVYYLDRTGRISGIMIWGLPFTSTSNGGKTVLNEDVVNRMNEVIQSDGSVSTTWDSEFGVDVLEAEHLAEESRTIASLALGNTLSGKPLYRYTAAKPPSISSIGILKRKDQTGGGELLGENIFVRNDYDMEGSERPQSLVYVYPMDGWSSTTFTTPTPLDLLGLDDNNSSSASSRRLLEDRMERSLEENDLRGRPPKEEPLWLRRGDVSKMTNQRKAFSELMEANLKRGQFADGTEAIQFAPVPKVIENAKKTIKGWIDSEQLNEDGRQENDETKSEIDDQ